MVTPQLAVFLPFLASALAAWLVSAKLSQLFNGIIIIIAFLLAVGLCIITGPPLTSLNLTIIIGYCAAIFGLMKPLIDFAEPFLPSPLALLAPAAKVVDATPVVVPPPPPNKL